MFNRVAIDNKQTNGRLYWLGNARENDKDYRPFSPRRKIGNQAEMIFYRGD
jgi:hypothetical protein